MVVGKEAVIYSYIHFYSVFLFYIQAQSGLHYMYKNNWISQFADTKIADLSCAILPPATLSDHKKADSWVVGHQ